ncbi:MAG: hypothetical protein M1826_003963 [Phylliscum demangeonii]|nr:MAG: hypothetical protein M1826_003963 [Phylliscum demangeonii]
MPRSTQFRAGTPGQLTAADNLEAILVVENVLSMTCQSTGTDKLVTGQWVVDVPHPSHDGDVYNYGEVLRRQSRLAIFGWELPSFLRRFQKQRRIVLPSMRDVLLLTTNQLGAKGFYSTRPDLFLPEVLTNPIFIAPMADDVPKEVVIKAYRLWGHVEPLVAGGCNVDKESDSSPSVRYRALFLLYGRGNSIRDSKNKWDIAPVCQEASAKKVAADGHRARASSKMAVLARHNTTRTTL